jgi:hypothetical protein
MLLLGSYPLDRDWGFHDLRHGIPARIWEDIAYIEPV